MTDELMKHVETPSAGAPTEERKTSDGVTDAQSILAAERRGMRLFMVRRALADLDQRIQQAEKGLEKARGERERAIAELRRCETDTADLPKIWRIQTDGSISQSRALLRVAEKICTQPYILDTHTVAAHMLPRCKLPLKRKDFLRAEVVGKLWRNAWKNGQIVRSELHPGLRAFVSMADASLFKLFWDTLLPKHPWLTLVPLVPDSWQFPGVYELMLMCEGAE
jgi:hypothetical protein